MSRALFQLLSLWALVACPSLLPGQDNSQTISEVSMTELRIQNVASDSIVFDGRILIRARERAEVKHISFRDVTLSGSPVFLGDFDERFELPANVLTALPGQLRITAYFRDATPDALERVLAANEVRLDGTAVIQVELNFLQSLVTMRKSVQTEARIGASTPLSFPGGDIGRNAALAALRAARPFWPVISSVASGASAALSSGGASVLSGSEPPTADRLLREYAGSLALVVSNYQMQDKNGQIQAFEYSGMGFRISPDEIAVPKEAVRPWEFNPGAMALEVNRKAKPVRQGTDVFVFFDGEHIEGSLARPVNGIRLSRGQLRLRFEGASDKDSVYVMDGPKRIKAELHNRATPRNLAILQLASPASEAARPEAPASESEKTFWDRLTVFRPKVATDGEVHFEAIEVHGHREGAKLVIETPVDRSAVGSPIIANGILGMMQDEHGGSLLKDIFTANGYTVGGATRGTLP